MSNPNLSKTLASPLRYTPLLGSFFERYITAELAKAGITVNGSAPHDIQVSDPAAFRAIALEGSLGLGESYMLGQWHCERVDLLIEKIMRSEVSRRRYTPKILLKLARALLTNLQSPNRAKIVCEKHYDLDNELYRKMLDERMVYTCAYWKEAQTLEAAQEAKLDLICRKLDLKPGMRILDIGCGFGSFMKFAVEKYGVEAVGYSLSKEQIRLGEESCRGLPIQYVFADYREIQGTFDRVISIGMMEAVGHKNYRTYMEVIHRVLKDDGIALLHTVGHNQSTSITDPWVDKYIFPNGHLPSITQFGAAIENLFVMEDWHNFGPDYNRTLLAWHERFQAAWPELQKMGYDQTFKRMWEFYLLSFAGGFAARSWQLWHVVLTKKGSAQPHCRIG